MAPESYTYRTGLTHWVTAGFLHHPQTSSRFGRTALIPGGEIGPNHDKRFLTSPYAGMPISRFVTFGTSAPRGRVPDP